MAAVIRALVATVAIVLGICGSARATGRAVPALTGPVVDEAGLLSAEDRARLEGLARAARAEEGGQGVELQFLIVPSLDGESIEDFSIRVAEAWKIGSRGKDNGVLIVVARDDRQVRIEVGGGLEGDLTDAQAGRIIRQTIAPAFRAGHYGDGLYDAAVQVLGAVGALPRNVAEPPGASRPREGHGAIAVVIANLLFIVFLVIVSRRMGWSAFFLPLFFGGGGSHRDGDWGGGGGRRGGG
ncbi:MAG TPA: TPM domain-containing protein, partial [Polyangiaceae bacterium]|nr:TPM domain-containing protein [Polyangiaceae bacterium]